MYHLRYTIIVKSFLRRFLFLCVLLVIVAGGYAWVNLWVPANSVGLFYQGVDQSTSPILIEKSSFDWHWQRILPFNTTLLIVSTNLQNNEKNLSFYLPNASVYSGLINRSQDIFEARVSITMLYSIDPHKITNYVTQHYSKTRPLSGNNVHYQINNSISKQYLSLIQDNFFENISTTDNMEHEIQTTLISLIKKNISSLPIIIDDVSIDILQAPDLELYDYIVSSNQFKNPAFSDSNSQRLSQYLLFLKELETIANKSPKILDIIKIFPPSAFKEFLQE